MTKETIMLIVMVVIVLVVMIVLPMITNKKRQKALDEFQSKIGVGTKVMTAGGIIGTIIAINDNTGGEKEFTLETGDAGSKSTLTFNFRAIYSVISNPVVAQAEVKAEETPFVAPAEEQAEEKAEETTTEEK